MHSFHSSNSHFLQMAVEHITRSESTARWCRLASLRQSLQRLFVAIQLDHRAPQRSNFGSWRLMRDGSKKQSDRLRGYWRGTWHASVRDRGVCWLVFASLCAHLSDLPPRRAYCECQAYIQLSGPEVLVQRQDSSNVQLSGPEVLVRSLNMSNIHDTAAW